MGGFVSVGGVQGRFWMSRHLSSLASGYRCASRQFHYPEPFLISDRTRTPARNASSDIEVQSINKIKNETLKVPISSSPPTNSTIL